MSCVYCAPKSRIRTRWAWMSACLAEEGSADRGTLAMGSLGHPVVGCLFRDRYIVYVTLADTGVGDTHEHRPRAQIRDVAAARVTHGGAEAARQLLQDGHHAALVRNAALDAFRDELLQLRGGVLEIA